MGDQNLDPQFVDPSEYDYHLQPSSPCIGSGRYDGDRGALVFEPTSIAESQQKPESYIAIANYPNPFNASTVIEYSLPVPAEVHIDIYDITGREIETLTETSQAAGHHRITFSGAHLPSGVYFYNLIADNYKASGKMVLLK